MADIPKAPSRFSLIASTIDLGQDIFYIFYLNPLFRNK